MDEHIQKYPDLYFRRNGVLYDATATNKESLEKLNEYSDIREDDIVVWTYPKSGTHALLDVAWKLAFDGDLDKFASVSEELWFEASPPDNLPPHNPAARFTKSLEELSASKSPRIIGTHVRFDLFPMKIQNGAAKVIYVSRNPKDVCVSLYEMLLKWWELGGRDPIDWARHIESFLDGRDVLFGSWADHMKSFYAVKDRENILWVKYDEFVADLGGQVQRICDFLGRQLDEATITKIAESCRFANVKKQFPNSLFLRKGQSGGWRERFTVAQSEHFDRQMRLSLGDLADAILN